MGTSKVVRILNTMLFVLSGFTLVLLGIVILKTLWPLIFG